MSDNTDGAAEFYGLQFCWFDISEHSCHGEVGAWWGQLCRGSHHFVSVRDEFGKLCRQQRNVKRAMERLERCFESYLFHVYALRERALKLLGSYTNNQEAVKTLRKPRKRNSRLPDLKSKAPELTDAVVRLLELMDNDIDLRNYHTHQVYIGLTLYTGFDYYDPYDALDDVSCNPTSLQELEAHLRREIKSTARQYFDKAQTLIYAVMQILDIANPNLCKGAKPEESPCAGGT